MDRKKLGLGNVVSISVGLVIATSCLVSLGDFYTCNGHCHAAQYDDSSIFVRT